MRSAASSRLVAALSLLALAGCHATSRAVVGPRCPDDAIGLAPAAPTPELRLPATTLELAAFEGERAFAIVLLEGDARAALAVAVAAPPGLRVVPENVEIPPGRTAALEVSADADAASLTGTLRFAVEPREQNSRSEARGAAGAPRCQNFTAFHRELRVRLVRGRAEPRALDLGRLRPGETGRATLALVHATLEPAELRGPRGFAIAVVTSGVEVLARIPDAAPPGSYEGALEARCGNGSRTSSLRLEVAPGDAGAPSRLELTAAFGWTRTTFELAAPAKFELEPLVLDGGTVRLSPELDMRTSELAPGRYELRVFAAASVPEGRYTGVLTAHIDDGGERRIPVTLSVRR
jgi:hypothetical protein